MTAVDDGLSAFYAERLWQLLPELYRTADTASPDAPGPLREVVTRIGTQVAVVRRSIDRLWEDQSIETCADWVIPYIGDLLSAGLVDNQDPLSQRRDVAKTIHYRRRKGTVQVLEELAGDITGWTAHVQESMRGLARSRHSLDPAIGNAGTASALAAAESLRGLLTGTPAGGVVDLRNPHGAALADTAFDESFHSADVRRGQGALGHHAIPTLLAFVWRLRSFAVAGSTPVPVAGTVDAWGFDPTGREIPLFLPPGETTDPFADDWTPAREWEVPGPLTTSLLRALSDQGAVPPLPPRPPYPATSVPPAFDLGTAGVGADVEPERGRFSVAGAAPATVSYHYGFPALLGAGPYDRDLLGDPPATVGAETVVAGGDGLPAALAAAGSTGTVTVGDSRTYTAVGTATPVQQLLVRAGARCRPVLRPPDGSSPWIFTAAPDAEELVLDGLVGERHRHRPARRLPSRPHHRLHARPRFGHARRCASPRARRTTAEPVSGMDRGRSGGRERRRDRRARRRPLRDRADPHAPRRRGRGGDDQRQRRAGPPGSPDADGLRPAAPRRGAARRPPDGLRGARLPAVGGAPRRPSHD